MGDYTTNQKFYRPASADLVDVTTDIQYNWNRIDDRVKRCIEWMPSNVPTLTGNVPLEQNFKYYKTYSGSKWYSDGFTGVQAVTQDFNAFVPSWSVITTTASWGITGNLLMASQTFSVEDMVHYRGLIQYTAGDIPVKTNTLIATGVPVGFRPLGTDREFQVQSGDTTAGNVATAMLRFTTTGEIRMWKYGAAGTYLSSLDRLISFAGITFNRAA